MKFTAGYLLGAGTAVGIIGAFGAGAIAILAGVQWLDEKKDEKLDKAKDISSLELVSDFLRRAKN